MHESDPEHDEQDVTRRILLQTRQQAQLVSHFLDPLPLTTRIRPTIHFLETESGETLTDRESIAIDDTDRDVTVVAEETVPR